MPCRSHESDAVPAVEGLEVAQSISLRARATDAIYGVMLMPRSKKIVVCSCFVATLSALGARFAGAQVPPAGAPTEAPAGFHTPSFNNDRAIGPEAQEHIPETENIRALRATLNTLGDGFVEAIADSTLIAIAAAQPKLSEGRVNGEVVQAPIFEAPGQTRVGRFGWKDQHSSLLSFIADAYLNEMGITSRLRPNEVTTVLLTTTGINDQPDDLGLEDIDHFAQFVRGTMVPPRDTALAATPAALVGEVLFTQIGCNVCHVQTITTVPAGTVINGGMFVVPAALGNEIIHPYGDFLLHDIGTGDGIVQGGPQDTANKLRTAPLWGLREKARFMHDLRSLSLEDAIARHEGEAREPARRFRELSPEERKALITFLHTL
jgi:CxxC motif-containing protein (DUF1111 family)